MRRLLGNQRGKETQKMGKKISIFKKYINGTKGVISLFLAILMVPFLTIIGSLINAARLNSAVAIFDEALCNASNSTLGTYDEFLRDRFGLMAISQNPDTYAKQLGISAVEYTSEDFIQELFVYYMEKNLESLSNTYDDSTLNAIGIYPLGDTTVLRSSILQASKITVPAELAVEWSSLEDFMNMLTKPFDVFASIEDAMAGGVDVVAAIDKLTDSQDKAEKQIETCNTARSNYETAYDELATAISEFNTLVDNINTAQSRVNTAQTTFDNLKGEMSGINAQIDQKNDSIDELKRDTSTDHSATVDSMQEELEELEDERDEVASEYDQAAKNLQSAKNTLKKYMDQFAGKQSAVSTKKTNYKNKIVALQTEINKTRDAVIEFQNAGKELVSNAVGFIEKSTTAGLEVAQQNCDNKKNQLEEENKYYQEKVLDAKTSTDAKAQEYFEKRIKENNDELKKIASDKLKYNNTGEVVSGAESTFNDVYGDLNSFANRDLNTEYKKIYDALDKCRKNVEKIAVPSGYTKVSYVKADIYFKVDNPVEKAEISTIIDNIEKEIVNSGGWAVIQTIFGFFDALTSIALPFDPNLNAQIDVSHYAANGGLPSKINRDEHPVTNPYEKSDAAISVGYKKELNTYSSEDVYEIAGEGESEAEKIDGYIQTIKKYSSPFKLKNLKKLWDAVKGLIGSLVKLGTEIVKNGVQTLLKGMRDRFYLVGYASYYMANRTTYTGKALSGASFDLPQHGQDEGYVFNGAELEYIFKGSLSERTNQNAAFTTIWVERMVWNAGSVYGDTLVQSLSTALGAVLPVIGNILVIVLFLAVEGYIDAMLMATGGEIPMIKSCIFLSPGGIPKLVEKILSLNLSEANRKKLYDTCTKNATKINDETNELVKNKKNDFTNKHKVEYPDYSKYDKETQELDKENKIRDMFTMNYTKSLQIWMMLFGNNEKYVKRMADIIQMEAAYNATHEDMIGYDFNLDKSYTYIRASGSFDSDVFMKVGEDEIYSSKKRVIYNGY